MNTDVNENTKMRDVNEYEETKRNETKRNETKRNLRGYELRHDEGKT